MTARRADVMRAMVAADGPRTLVQVLKAEHKPTSLLLPSGQAVLCMLMGYIAADEDDRARDLCAEAGAVEEVVRALGTLPRHRI